jgi:hypothetical protein
MNYGIYLASLGGVQYVAGFVSIHTGPDRDSQKGGRDQWLSTLDNGASSVQDACQPVALGEQTFSGMVAAVVRHVKANFVHRRLSHPWETKPCVAKILHAAFLLHTHCRRYVSSIRPLPFKDIDMLNRISITTIALINYG